MTMIEPYLFFDGRCEEALEFYRQAVGARIEMLMRFKDSPEPPPEGQMPPGSENKVMHASFQIGHSRIMASDGDCKGTPGFRGFSLSITVPAPDDAERVFNALAQGGTVTLPLTQTFWSPCFGMLTDRFGIGWMVGVESAPPT